MPAYYKVFIFIINGGNQEAHTCYYEFLMFFFFFFVRIVYAEERWSNYFWAKISLVQDLKVIV